MLNFEESNYIEKFNDFRIEMIKISEGAFWPIVLLIVNNPINMIAIKKEITKEYIKSLIKIDIERSYVTYYKNNIEDNKVVWRFGTKSDKEESFIKFEIDLLKSSTRLIIGKKFFNEFFINCGLINQWYDLNSEKLNQICKNVFGTSTLMFKAL